MPPRRPRPAGDGPDRSSGHEPDREVQRAREHAASRARQRAAYQRAQRASRERAVRAAAEDPGPAVPAGETTAPAEPTAVELAQLRLEEAELQRGLLDALAALPPDQRVAVVAALGYAEGAAGAAVELDVDPSAAGHLAEQGLAALRQALRPFAEE